MCFRAYLLVFLYVRYVPLLFLKMSENFETQKNCEYYTKGTHKNKEKTFKHRKNCDNRQKSLKQRKRIDKNTEREYYIGTSRNTVSGRKTGDARNKKSYGPRHDQVGIVTKVELNIFRKKRRRT